MLPCMFCKCALRVGVRGLLEGPSHEIPLLLHAGVLLVCRWQTGTWLCWGCSWPLHESRRSETLCLWRSAGLLLSAARPAENASVTLSQFTCHIYSAITPHVQVILPKDLRYLLPLNLAPWLWCRLMFLCMAQINWKCVLWSHRK